MFKIFILLSLLSAPALAQLPTYHCGFGGSGNACQFWDVVTDANNYRFEITSDNFNVNQVSVDGLNVTVLGRDICDKFQNLRFVSTGFEIGLERITADAFESCELSSLSISKNKVINLDFFQKLGNLDSFQWYMGTIQTLPIDIFRDLTNMQVFTWYYGDLRDFPSALIRNMPRLLIINLESNELSDIDVEGIYRNAPTLEIFQFDDNPIKCSRLNAIKSYLRSEGISYNSVDFGKIRDPPLERDVQGYHCVKD